MNGDSSQKQASTAPAPATAQASTQANAVAPHDYNPYPNYPFAPYACMPHINGQIVSNLCPPSLVDGCSSASAGPSSSVISSNSNKRSPRHCSKCGSQECKGKGGRSFCTNTCQDCGKLECKGRNSRRPDKKCSEGWQ